MFTRRLQEIFDINLYSLKLNRSASSKAAILVFLISSLSIVTIIRQLDRKRIVIERYRVANVANDYAIDIKTNIDRTLSVTYALAALVNQYQGVIPNFEKVAKDLLPIYPGAEALALLPNAGVKQFVVTKSNLNPKDLRDLQNLDYPRSSFTGKDTGELSLTDNFVLTENETAAVGYLPIFLESDRGKPYFWGFATVTIHFSDVLKSLSLEKLEQQGLAYRLQQINPETNSQSILAVSSVLMADRPVKQAIEIANTNWILSLTPVAGWYKPVKFWLQSLFGISFSLVLAASVKLLLDSKVNAFELEKIAYFDPLTSLPNRRLLLYQLEQIISRTKRNNKNVAICYLDLDDFKAINARLGYKSGDYILVRIAKRLQKFLRVEDLIARVGGDEFAIVLQDLSEIEEAEVVLERIIEAVTSPIMLGSETIAVSASIGVAMYSQGDCSTDVLLNNANQAMNRAKKDKKGSYILFWQLEQTIAQSPSI